MNLLRKLILAVSTASLLSSCVISGYKVKKSIVFDVAKNEKLNLYYPKNVSEKSQVLVFVHGGNWRSGNRKMYRFFARRLAQKGIVCAVVDYQLSDKQDYQGMAMDVSNAVAWVYN